MSEVARLRDQLERAHSGDAWHGPSLKELLSDVDAAAAEAHPIEEAHSIRELVAHMITWEDEAVRRIQGDGRDLPPDQDWPGGAESWDALTRELDAAHQRLRAATRDLAERDLERATIGTGGTLYHLLHGIVQHNLYHGGQIALLKKASSR